MTHSLGAALDELAAVIAARADERDAGASYTARLISQGVARCAQKFGEEAVETVLAAAAGDKTQLTAEASDSLDHHLVLLRASGVAPEDVAGELDRRAGVSGLDEKAARQQE
jgi:phosphoribosyl-ATP pyrophosphohydrolase